VVYSDSVEEFSGGDENEVLPPGYNYFDFWIGSNTLEQANLLFASDNRLKASDKLLTFCTIDFYNHDTQHTNIAQGFYANYNFQVSYKVNCDEFFLQFLEVGSLKLEIYATQGIEPIKLGSLLVPLRELITRNNQQEVSAVVASKQVAYAKDDQKRIIACLEFKFRMRLPIYQTVKWLQEKKKLHLLEDESPEGETDQTEAEDKKLVIVVDKAQNLFAKAQSFVYYSLLGKDFYSSTVVGSAPRYDFHQLHTVSYDSKFRGFLK